MYNIYICNDLLFMVVTTIIVFGPLGIPTNNSFYIIMYSFKKHHMYNMLTWFSIVMFVECYLNK